MDIHAFWKAVLEQDAVALPAFFTEDAVIRWHCSGEQFTVAEYVRANCEYPGRWAGEMRVRIPPTISTLSIAKEEDNAGLYKE